MRFEEAYEGWTSKRLTQEEAARLLGVCDRSFRRYVDRYHDEGLDGLIDKRLSQVSHHKAPTDEVLALETGDAFVPLLATPLDDILCLKTERTVWHDNCVKYRGVSLQIPKQQARCHYVNAKVKVHEYQDGTLAVFHGPRRLADYSAAGIELSLELSKDIQAA